MFAVFGPGLGENFQFDIGGFVESELRTVLRIAEIVLDGLHLLQRKRQRSLVGDFHEFFIGDFKVDQPHLSSPGSVHDRFIQRHAVLFHLRAGKDPDRFDEFIGQDAAGDSGNLFRRQSGRLKQIFDRTVHILAPVQLPSDDVPDRLARGAAHVIGHAGTIAHRNNPVKVKDFARRGLSQLVILEHRIRQFLCNFFRLRTVYVGGDGENIPCPDGDNVFMKEIRHFLQRRLASCVMPFRFDGDFDSVIHHFPTLSF